MVLTALSFRTARADDVAASFTNDLRDLTSYGPRIIGSVGYENTLKYLRREIGKLPNVELREQAYQVMVPVTQRAELRLPDGKVAAVYPFWPAQVRLNTTPDQGITGRLVYCGNASFEEIHPAELNGQIAVIEASAGAAWPQVFYFGAKAVLVLGSDNAGNDVLRYHDLQVPVDLPRFYLPEESSLAADLRQKKIIGAATLTAQGRWESKTATNLYALVQPPLTQAVNSMPLCTSWALSSAMCPVSSSWTQADSPGALAVSAPLESSGLVPDLAVGASQAVQTAAALELLRDFANRPLQRPVLVCFEGADSIQMIGTRQMFMALSDVPQMWRDALTDLQPRENAQAADLATAIRVKDDPRQLDPTRDRSLIQRLTQIIETDAAVEMDELFRLRMAGELSQTDAQRRKTLERNQVVYNALKYAIEQQPSKLSDVSPQPGEKSPLEMARTIVQWAIVQLGGQTDAKGNLIQVGLAQQYQARQQALESRINLYQWLASRLHRDPNPGVRSNNSRLIELLTALDFSDGSTRCGPLYWGWFQRTSNITSLQDYKDWFTRQERGFNAEDPDCQWMGTVLPRVNFSTLSVSESPNSYLCASMPIGSEECPSFGVPGFTFTTLDDLRRRRDTPGDTLAHINVQPIAGQFAAVRTLLRHAWNDPAFKGPVEIKWEHEKIRGQVVSLAPGRPVPDLPRPGFLATYYYAHGPTIPGLTWLPYTIGVRRGEVAPCDAEGNYLFEGLSRLQGGAQRDLNLQSFAVEVYRIENDGRISACTDLGQAAADIKTFVDLRQSSPSLRSLVFDCREFSLVGLYDPRFLQDLRELQLVDARRNADPQRFNYMIDRQMMAGFVEPDFLAYMAFRYGRIGNRLILLNMDKPQTVAGVASAQQAVREAAHGYDVNQLQNVGPLSLATSRDFARIDDIRIERYRRAGVSSDLIDAMQKDSDQSLASAQSAYQANRGDQFVRDANSAWSSQARVYQAAQDMANDVIRGAIFLLLLCIPFSFCMERLLLGSSNIYRQLIGMAAIFALMTLALCSFHPAFKISASPLIVILAFAIIAMSIVVIAVIYSKFDAELKRLRSGRGTSQGASFARASVLMSAVLLGIANMRKRKFRTALTSLTIILITFAVLCFTSASRYLDVTSLPTGTASSHSGIMLRQRGWRPMPLEALANLHAVLPGVQLVERWWNVNPSDTSEVIHVVAGGGSGSDEALKPHQGDVMLAADVKPAGPPAPQIPQLDNKPLRVFSAKAVLGLSPGEGRLSAIRDVIGPDFDRLENGGPENRIIYLSRAVAKQLQVQRGDYVSVGGILLQVAGVFDGAEFDQRVQTLSGEQIAPLNYTSGELDSAGRQLSDNNSMESLSLDEQNSEAELGGAYEHLSASQIVIVPAAISRLLPNATLRSVAFALSDSKPDLRLLAPAELRDAAAEQDIDDAAKMNQDELIQSLWSRGQQKTLKNPSALDDALVRDVSTDLAKRFSIVEYAGRADGVKMITASNLAAISGAGQIAIPLAIASLIIFNTMMGSIAERKREIHIYTSLGLAPLHVGALFVAEAMTYGVIGTVFGYVIGQGIGTFFNKMGWLGGVTLNYSGTSAMLTMSLILMIVLLSALVPARLASKLAAPSIDRTWRVPLPKNGEIIAQLPFTINKTAADGALAYLAEFFDAHREGSIGKFSSGKVDAFTFEDTAHRLSRGLKTIIWLTPFDLGVRQHIMLLIHPGQYQDIYEVQVVLQRLSGDDGNWYRMNRTFLTELRKQFLQWRSLTPRHMLQYVEESRRLFQTG